MLFSIYARDSWRYPNLWSTPFRCCHFVSCPMHDYASTPGIAGYFRRVWTPCVERAWRWASPCLFQFVLINYFIGIDDALELQLLHSSTLSEKDFISHLHFMTGSGLLLVTYCFSHEVWVVSSFRNKEFLNSSQFKLWRRLVDPRNMQTISSNRSSSNMYVAARSAITEN